VWKLQFISVMQKDSNVIMVGWTTVSDKNDGRKLVNELLDLGLIACGQIGKSIESIYFWEGQKVTTEEYLVILKFPQCKTNEISCKISTIHPYDTPQWVYKEMSSTNEFAQWVNQIRKT